MKILVVLEAYCNKSDANAICLETMVRIWTESGAIVKILSVENSDYAEANDIFIIKKNTANNQLLRNAYKFFQMPLKNCGLSKKLANKIIDINEQERLDAIIFVVNPIETAASILYLKNRINNIKTVLYEIDPASNRYKNPKNILERLWKIRSMVFEKRVYSHFDYIIHMINHKRHFMDPFYCEFNNKTIFLDIPAMRMKIDDINIPPYKYKKTIRFLYTGAFYPELRNPSRVFEIMNALYTDMTFEFNVYTNSDCKKYIRDEYKWLNLHAYVKHDELRKIYDCNDILVDIGNKDSDFLASKFFEYFGLKKPVIHFAPDSEDVAIKYFDKYPIGTIIDQNKNIKTCAREIRKFIDDIRTLEAEHLSWNDYYENTPEYSAKRIMELIIG